MSQEKKSGAKRDWVKNAAVYATAIMLTAMVLPAGVIGWYYADPQSFGAVIGTAIDYSVRL